MLVFDTRPEGSAVVITVDDDLDMANVDALRRSIGAAEAHAAGDAPIVVAFSDGAYCDSSGLSLVIREWKRLGSRLRVVVPASGPCRRLFDLTDVAQLPFVFDTVGAALASPLTAS